MLLSIRDGVTRHPLYRMRHPVNFEMCEGEHIAIIGNNGAGKSMLTDILTGKHPLLGEGVKYDFGERNDRMVSDNIRHVVFKDTYGTGEDSAYYQLRWNKHEDDTTPYVADILNETFTTAEHSETLVGNPTKKQLRQRTKERELLRQRLYEAFAIDSILHQRLSLLSSGEMRKFQITRALLSNPRLVIIENPYIGLDVEARQQLTQLLQILVNETTMQILLIVSRPEDIPPFITHIYNVHDMTVDEKMTFTDYQATLPLPVQKGLSEDNRQAILDLPAKDDTYNHHANKEQCVIDFHNVSIRYGKRTILHNLNLTVMPGEHWVLSGENGAGKSTLLSIVCADNLQSYANHITLFGTPRGSGESIWDIKKHIGYVSPELHRSYSKDIPAIEVVASGLSDSVGLYKRPRPEQMGTCEFWMNIFGILPHRDTPFLHLSSGEQRLVLLARAFVKDPALLILDEPLHGLDPENRRLTLDIIETFCQRQDKTLIMVTHYEEDIPRCIDHRMRLKRNTDI